MSEAILRRNSGTHAVVTGGSQGLGLAIAKRLATAAYMLSPESGVMTGALIDYDQRVMGAYE